jgi:TorA maturation chaperone TorD
MERGWNPAQDCKGAAKARNIPSSPIHQPIQTSTETNDHIALLLRIQAYNESTDKNQSVKRKTKA